MFGLPISMLLSEANRLYEEMTPVQKSALIEKKHEEKRCRNCLINLTLNEDRLCSERCRDKYKAGEN